MNVTQPLTPSVLAFITTLHLALVVLRVHRSPAGTGAYFVGAISLLFAGSPWLLPSPVGIVVGFVTHVAWFVVCDRLLGAGAPPQRPSPAAPRAPVRASTGAPTGIAKAARRPRDFVQTPVLAVLDETADIRTFRLARPEGFDFKAGQFLTVRLRAEGREHVRCYSISSPPSSGGYLEISVKRIGLVSGALHATVRPGTTLAVRAPAGSFFYPADDERPLVLLAGGVGITPLMSMLRHAVNAEPGRPVTLFYSVRRVEDIAFADELALLTRRHGQLRVFVAISDGEPGPGHFPGFISESLITTMVPDVAHAICLICGPQPMMNAMTDLLVSIGVPRSQIRFEIFQAAVAASTDAGTEAAPAPSASADAHAVTFTRSGQQASVAADQTLLEAAEGCGADIPSLCRAGVCGTCRTRVVEGDVHCSSSMLDDEDRAEGWVLPCVTHVRSDCRVDA